MGTRGLLKGLALVDVALVMFTLLHYAGEGAYWRSLEQALRDEKAARASWEQHVMDVRRISAHAVSRSSQLQTLRSRAAEAAKCPPVKCPKPKPCPKPRPR